MRKNGWRQRKTLGKRQSFGIRYNTKLNLVYLRAKTAPYFFQKNRWNPNGSTDIMTILLHMHFIFANYCSKNARNIKNLCENEMQHSWLKSRVGGRERKRKLSKSSI